VKILLTLVLAVAFVSSAQARLGETPEQIEKRFGKTIGLYGIPSQGPDSGLQQEGFKTQGFDILVLFTHISIGETYTWQGRLSEDQIQTLLMANSEGHHWKELHSGGPYRFWTRDDGATASWNISSFAFKSKFLVDKEEAWRQAQLPNVQGF